MKQSDINPRTTAAFTGHRWYDFSQREELKARLKDAVRKAHSQGITNFLLFVFRMTGEDFGGFWLGIRNAS